jgi:membrane protein
VIETGSLSWSELARRTWKEVVDDDVLGLAAQLSYYFFLALFPAILFLLALASFFPLTNITDDVGRSLGPFVSPQVLELIQEQMRRLANNENGGLLTSASPARCGAARRRSCRLWGAEPRLRHRRRSTLVEGAARRHRPHARCRRGRAERLVADPRGPTLAEKLGQSTGWGAPFEWAWLVLQWPLVFRLIAVGIGLIYYFGPDADQDWAWITPGAVAATMLWVLVSLLFKIYVANFTDYEGSYGTVGAVIVVLLWFYVSGIAILTGAELNAEIEHASPYGKAPGQKNAQGKLMIGARAARAFRERQLPGTTSHDQAGSSRSDETVDDTAQPSPAPAVAAASETRLRPATGLTRTADHLDAAPATAAAEAGRGGVRRGAVMAMAVMVHTKRAWDDARRTGVLRRAAVGAALALAAVFVVTRRER